MSALSLPYCIESVSSSKSATLPRRHRRQLSNDSTYITSREHSPSLRYRSSPHASSSLPRNNNNNNNNVKSPLHTNKSRESSRKTSRSSLATKTSTSSPGEIINNNNKKENNNNKESKLSSVESLKTSHTNNLDEKSEYESCNDKNTEIEQCGDNNLKSFINLDNSGPSSIESHKSSKTGSSLTSGPSSLESHKTVISRTPTVIRATDKISKKSPKRRDSLKQRETTKITPLNLASSNSFTLQVTTNQNGNSYSNGNASASATINSGTGTKIYVQNSPVRSVITFENGQNNDPNPNLVIINGTPTTTATNETAQQQQQPMKNLNNQQVPDGTLNNSRDTINNENSFIKQETMNNSRKLSLQMPQRDTLNYKNVIKNVPDSPITNGFRDFTKNSFDSNPPSPTKTYDTFGGSASNVYNTKNLTDSITSLDKSYNSILDFGNKLVEKNILGSEPNISCNKDSDKSNHHHHQQNQQNQQQQQQQHQLMKDQFPSLSDFNFTSLAAQKILKGVSINSIDTLVELNMAANNNGEKQNNCDVVHTDFGLV